MYDLLTEKIAQHYPGFASVNEKLKREETREKFGSLEVSDKLYVIRQIIIMLHANPSNGNLEKIGLTKREGRKSSFNLAIDKAIFVNTSPTGIFENSYNGKDL